ncbi:MAG: metal-dependent transcriptional regulator [Armatimonadota bacterium]|nr:metal-dependent transcriptional regulator [Armatimonadota bacterium]MDR7438655.1 metal-dependent transcriptional regulator [Armatimonadota bacterium]MDR7568639.1 metal-dependent transcriptional regulator [Armatimonadota bacterium]MDR7601828.1 metal-dependent transcriptional regulator [Armatimonadota bacterium]
MTTAAVQDYLKVIYKLAQGGRVSTNAIARRMKVAPASVTKMLKRLSARGLVAHTPYRGVRLTPKGERAALEVIRHHRLVERYLADRLGLPVEAVHEEAERLEHVLSELLEERIAASLGDPRFDPHGDPIPTREGWLRERHFPRLSEVSPGVVWVARVRDSDARTLRQVARLGLLPGGQARILGRRPGGRVEVQLPSGSVVRLARRVAESIFVETGP